MAKMTKKQTAKVAKVMGEFKDKKLHGGINPKGPKKAPVVKSRKQAIAIALSEANSMKKKKGMAAGGMTSPVAVPAEQARMRQAFASGEQYNPQKPQVAKQTATPTAMRQLAAPAAKPRSLIAWSSGAPSAGRQAKLQTMQAYNQKRDAERKPTAMPKANPAMGRGMSQSGLSQAVDQAMQDFSKQGPTQAGFMKAQATTQAPAGSKMMQQPAQTQAALSKMMQQPAQTQAALPGLAPPKMAKGGVVKKGMAYGGTAKKGMAKGGVAKKGMASGGMAKKGCK
jgi:hypothetical protein